MSEEKYIQDFCEQKKSAKFINPHTYIFEDIY